MFRAVNCSLLSLAAVMILRITRQLGLLLLPAAFAIGLFIIDAKIIDFSINGMEAAFMVVFLAATIYLLTVPTSHVVVKLGLAWGGMMWTRPDSFVYIGGLALGYLLFSPGTAYTRNRKELLRLFGVAGLVTTAVYLPWLLWSWAYYGSPIPHTVVAKGLMRILANGLTNEKLNTNVIEQLIKFPYMTVFGASSVVTTLLPPNYIFGGWPGKLLDLYGVLALICTYYWCLPYALPVGRVLSFTCFLAHFYLTSIASAFYPWYLPSVTLLSTLVLGHILQQGVAICRRHETMGRYLEYLFRTCAVMILTISLLLTVATAHQMKLQQNIIEDGHRKQIGLWLKGNASSPGDTVFLECLGYIGFYSQLKMLDFPGMSSPEVVAARRKLHSDDFGLLIEELQPDWLVLRPFEIESVEEATPGLLNSRYRMVKTFDVSNEIDSYPLIFGRPYLQHDQIFVVFRKQAVIPVAR
jgi:hypothetical protein